MTFKSALFLKLNTCRSIKNHLFFMCKMKIHSNMLAEKLAGNSMVWKTVTTFVEVEIVPHICRTARQVWSLGSIGRVD